jgi:aminopeptidase
MVHVDYSFAAAKMIKALGIREGEVVLVTGGLHTAELLEEVVLAARCAGASVISELVSDRLHRRVAFEVPLKYLESPSLPHLKKMEMVNCIISLGTTDDPLLMADLSLERRQAMGRASVPGMKVYDERKRTCQLRTLGMGFPTKMRADFFGLPYEEYHDLFWRAVLIDLKAMREKQRAISRHLREALEVRIESAKGTDIVFSLEGRAIMLDSGLFEEEDFASKNMTTNWPCGEVWVAPVEQSAEGIAVFDSVFHQGKEIVDLRLTFREGRVVEHAAAENADLFTSMLSEAQGDRDRLGELGIGTNPEVTRVTGDTMLDEKIIGTVHLALGSNSYFGGKNVSTLHKDMVILKPTLRVGEKILMKEGEFCV